MELLDAIEQMPTAMASSIDVVEAYRIVTNSNELLTLRSQSGEKLGAPAVGCCSGSGSRGWISGSAS